MLGIQNDLGCSNSRPEATRKDAHIPVPAEKVTFIQQDAVSDQKEEAKAGQIIYGTSACTNSSFLKTLRNRNYLKALELPATFVKEHGHNCKTTVVLQGPSGHSTVVQLNIKSYAIQARVHFRGVGWRAFVLENGLKVGHRLVFSLVSNSTFVVRHCPGAANVKIQESVGRIETSKRGHGMSRANLPEMSIYYRTSGRQLVGVGCRNAIDEPARPSVSEFHASNTFANKSPEDVSVPHVMDEVVYPRGTRRSNRNVGMLVEKLQCPHFVTTIRKSYLSKSLSVPAEFFDKHGTYFSKKVNTFQGPTGRIVEVCFSRTKNLRFTTGWNAFYKQNDLKLGDVLLFSLQTPACWLVQVVESHSRAHSRRRIMPQ